jgi:hypothetical protein
MRHVVNFVANFKLFSDNEHLLSRIMDVYIAVAFSLYLYAYQWSKVLFDTLGIIVLLFLSGSLLQSLFGKANGLSLRKIDIKSPYLALIGFLLMSFLGFFMIWGHFSLQWTGWMEGYFFSILNALLFVVYWYRFPESGKKHVVYMLIALPILNGLGALYEFFILLNQEGRVGLQFNHPVLYGGMGFIAVSLVSVLTFSQRMVVRYLSFVAIAVGSIGVLLSGTRSASFGLIILLFLLSFFHLYKGSLRKGIAVSLLFVLIAACFNQGFHSIIQQRLNDTRYELQQMRESDGAVVTSINTRVSFWKTARVLFDYQPLFGLGVEGMKRFIEEYNAGFNYQKFDRSVAHPHADMLVGWYAGGLLGVLLLVWLYGFPVWFARRYCDQQYQCLVSVFVVSFAAVGLADSYFLETVSIKFYVCFLTLLLLFGLKPCFIQPQRRSIS